MKKIDRNKFCKTIAGGIVAAFLVVPAVGQAAYPLTNCSDATKVKPAYKQACEADMLKRIECNKKTNPEAQKACYEGTTAKQTTATAPPADPNIVTSIPQGARNCAKDGGKCLVDGNWTGVYGANNSYVKISGSGSFTCLPKDLKVNDPAPKVAKNCWVIGKVPAPAAKAPVASVQPKVNPLPLSCSGGLINATRKFTSPSDFSKAPYAGGTNTAATDLTGATAECKASCARTGEPAPCGWYTLVQWRNDSSASGKSTMSYTCYMVNERSAKGAFKPTLEKDKNFGNPANGLFFREAYTYPCAR